MELKCKDTEAVDAEANRTREGRKRTRICTRERILAREFGSGQKFHVSTSLLLGFNCRSLFNKNSKISNYTVAQNQVVRVHLTISLLLLESILNLTS